MRILFPMIGFGRAGGFRVLSKLADGLLELGHEVTMVSFDESDEPYFPTKARVLWVDLLGRASSRQSTYGRFLGLKRMIALLLFLFRQNRAFDVVVANHNLTAWPVFLASRSRNYYYIQAYEPEFYLKERVLGRLHAFFAWLTYFLPLRRIVNAHLYLRYKNIRSEIVVLPGLDLGVFRPADNNSRFGPTLVVGCIGRREVWKGSDDVGEAIRLLREQGMRIVLRVAYNPISYGDHEIVEPTNDEELADFYRSLDILVAPGHIQQGAVHYPVIEAMACGVPVITTGYYPACNSNSVIVQPHSPSQIARSIRDLEENPVRRDAIVQQALADIQQFAWTKVVRLLADAIAEPISHTNS